MILDLGLPDIDGIDVCRRLRAARPDLAILILTARDQELDVVAGLDAGADDYLVKPFRLSELLARVRAPPAPHAVAAEPEERDEPLRAGDVAVDRAARRAWRGGEELALRPKEFDLLALLVAEAGRAVTRERIMREVWDTDWLGSTKTLDTHVLALRNKLGAGGDHHPARRRLPLRGRREAPARHRDRRRVAGAAVILFAVPLAVVLQRSYRDEDLLRLQRDTVAATRGIDVGVQPGDPIELPRSPDALAVYDRAGRRVAGRGPATAPPIVASVLRTGRPADDAHGGQLEVAVPLLDAERVTGAVRAVRSTAGAVHDTRGAWLVLAAIAAGLIAAAGLAALVLGRRLAAPLERLGGAARILGEGDFSVRSPRAGVAEVDAVGAALDATAARLGDVIARERAFSADASHQLRTPLAALRLELEAMELREPDHPELAAALAQVDRLQVTIETLLSIARDARRPGEVADLAALVDDAESRWRDVLAAEARPLRSRTTARPATARASRRVVDEILDVLLDNAHVHGRGAVTLTVRDVDGWLALDVADEGAGFSGDPELAMTRRARGDGHGIGLALARELAHAEGGRIVVTSAGPRPVLTLLWASRNGPPHTPDFFN